MTAIGKIQSSHGVKGEVFLEHNLEDAVDFSKWDALMIELLPGSQIPFFIERIKSQSNTLCLVKLEEINSPEEASAIIQKNVFLSPNIQAADAQTKKAADSFIGYTLFDKDKKIGLIDNILNPKTNPLFIINEDKENELLIPANEELILNVDVVNKIITADVPEGLL